MDVFSSILMRLRQRNLSNTPLKSKKSPYLYYNNKNQTNSQINRGKNLHITFFIYICRKFILLWGNPFETLFFIMNSHKLI